MAPSPRTRSTLNCDGSQSESHQTAEAGKNQAFNENLTHEPTTTRAEGETNSELVDASRCARQHEVGDIDACHKEHKADGNEKEMQRTTCGRDEILLQRNGNDCAQARGRPTFSHRPAQTRELFPSLLETDPASQAANGAQRIVLRIGVPREVVRKPRVYRAGDRILESLGRNGHHLVRFTAQLNGGSDD